MKTETVIVLALVAGAVVFLATRKPAGQSSSGGVPVEPETYLGPGDALFGKVKGFLSSSSASSTRQDGSLDVRKVVIAPDPLDAIDGADYRL